MKVQRGKHVLQADGTLKWVTWYEDTGPGRARTVYAGPGSGAEGHSNRKHKPPTGFSVTLGATPNQDPDSSKLMAVLQMHEFEKGKGNKPVQKRRKAA